VTFLDRHHGPYSLSVTRQDTRQAIGKQYTCQHLPGASEKDDVEAEAWALIDDPKDTIVHVHVWSEPEQCYVGGYRKSDTRRYGMEKETV
jgi:hypothetical protein